MLDAKTKLVALLGHPVGHSMSPAMHNAAFEKLGLNFTYLAFDVVNLKSAVQAMRDMGFAGYSVTIPHKQEILKHLDRVDSLAAKIGAVNTVVNKDGLLLGYNTDALAAANALKAKTALNGKRIALVGAGGAGRAIAFALHQENALVTMFDADFTRAKSLARLVGCEYLALEKLGEFNSEILVNATPVGMHPKVDASPVDKSILKNGMLVFDIIYNPVETLLQKQAKSIGCETISGVEMFIGQGVEQFRLWTGKDAPVELMREVVLRELNK